MTGPIYRQGSIGAAKAHLEQTALALSKRDGVEARTSVNGAAVTQASSAIPGIGLYVSLLHKVLGEQMQTPMQQSIALWDQLTGEKPAGPRRGRPHPPGPLGAGRRRAGRRTGAVGRRDPGNIADVADTEWFYSEVRRLYGFDVAGVDYEEPCEVDVDWPARS